MLRNKKMLNYLVSGCNIDWLHTGGIAVINHEGSSSVWFWGIIFTLHWGKGELEQLDVAVQVVFNLLFIIIDQYQ